MRIEIRAWGWDLNFEENSISSSVELTFHCHFCVKYMVCSHFGWWKYAKSILIKSAFPCFFCSAIKWTVTNTFKAVLRLFEWFDVYFSCTHWLKWDFRLLTMVIISIWWWNNWNNVETIQRNSNSKKSTMLRCEKCQTTCLIKVIRNQLRDNLPSIGWLIVKICETDGQSGGAWMCWVHTQRGAGHSVKALIEKVVKMGVKLFATEIVIAMHCFISIEFRFIDGRPSIIITPLILWYLAI